MEGVVDDLSLLFEQDRDGTKVVHGRGLAIVTITAILDNLVHEGVGGRGRAVG